MLLSEAIKKVKEIRFNSNVPLYYKPTNTKEVFYATWEDVEHAPDNLLYATCSACGKRQTIEYTNYCGNCGAKCKLDMNNLL